jgi:hypothetical protein
VGTDDGSVQLTRDGGGSWENLVDRIPGVPDNTWVPHIEASKHDAGTAYVVFDGHRFGDWTTYTFRTTDFGQSWQALAPEQIDGYVHVIEEDPVEPRLLFLGAEFGLYVSLDAGANWRKWTHGDYPAGAPTRALVVHPRDHDLAVGTHGRGAWILDDVRPLRALAADPALAEADLHLFDVPDAIAHARAMSGPFYFPGDTRYQGANRPYGALLSYLVSGNAAAAAAGSADATGADEADEAEEAAGAETAAEGDEADGEPGGGGPDATVTIEIMQSDTLVRTLEGPAKPGVNRIAWGLQRKGIPAPDADPDDPEPSGPEVLPGTYTVRVSLGEHTSEGTVQVLPDPRREPSVAVLQANLEVWDRGQRKLVELDAAEERLESTLETLAHHRARLDDWSAPDPSVRDSLLAETRELRSRANELLDRLRMPPAKGIVQDTTAAAGLRRALGEAAGSPYAPSQGRLQQLDWAEARVDAVLREVEAFHAQEVPAYRETLRSAGFELLGGG